MSFRSRRTRLEHLSKVKDTTSQSVQDVVDEVIRDVVATEDQDADTLHSSRLSGGAELAATEPTYCATNEVDQSTERDAGGKPSMTKPIILGITQSLNRRKCKSLVSDSRRPSSSERRPFGAKCSNDQAKHGGASRGAQDEETELGSDGNIWTNDTSMTVPMQDTGMDTDDFTLGQRNTVGRRSHTPPPSGSIPGDTSIELRHLQEPPKWLQENDGEPTKHGLSESEHSKLSKLNNGIGFDDMDEMEIFGGSVRHGPFSRSSKPVEWSSNLQFDDMEEVEMRDSEGRRGKKGGSILPRHVWSLRPGVRFVVPFNSLDQPVRKGGSVLVRFLGDVVKVGELCPLDEVSWPRVDKSCKENIIAVVREKFIIPDRQEIDKHILKHVGNRWKSYRHDLKSEYKKPGKMEEQVARIVPRGVIPSQWVKLVQYWFSEKSKKLSEKGKEARAALIHLHTGGSKSFAQKRDEFEKVHGREPGPAEWFLETHQQRDGTFVENSSKEFVDTAAAVIAQRGSASSSRRTVGNQVLNELSDDEKLYQQPVGYGFGINGKKVFGGESESRKRGYVASGVKSEFGGSKKKLFRGETEGRDSGYMPSDSSAEVERLNFAMTAMGEMNELMQGQIKMQTQQLQMQSQQLQMQSKQIEGLQQQLQQVTSLLTKFGSMLNNAPVTPIPTGVRAQGMNGTNRSFMKAADASPEYSDIESDSTDWDSDQ